MVDQVVIGFNDPHSAYHSADSIPPGGEDGIRVACSGGIGGREHPIVLPDALHTAHYVRASVPQCSRLCIRSRSAMHTPSERDGNRTRRPLGFGGPTVSRAHAHDSFFRTTGRGI